MKSKIALCFITMLLFSGCAKTQPEKQSIIYPPADVTGINVTYVDTGKTLTPISLIKDGTSLLSGENYYYNIESTVNNSDGLQGKTYTAFSCTGENNGNVSLDKCPKSEALITSGNWQLCPDMRYGTKATDEYREFVADRNITDVWEYDLDGDGANEAIIRACAENTQAIYIMSTTLGNSILQECEGTATPYIADFDGDGEYSIMTLCGNSFKMVTVYKEKSVEPEYTVYLPLE